MVGSSSSHNTMIDASAKTSGKKSSHLRWWLATVFFLIGLIAYMDRANLAVVAEAMMQEFGMSKVQFGLLGSLFALGYALAQIPGGILAERFGSRIVVCLSLVAWSFFTILTALTPRYMWLCVVRFLFGVGEAPTYPGNAVFNAWWFRKSEKARAASLLLAGSYFGPVIAPSLTVAIMMAFSWHMVFYIFGFIGILIALLWFIVARNRPEEHAWVSATELAYIREDRAIDVQGGTKIKAPWRQFMRHGDFWAVGIQYFLVAYMTSLFMIWLPTYLQEARNFSLAHMGIAASFPWLAICVCVLTGGSISDALFKRGYSPMVARGLVAIVGYMIFIVSICSAAFVTSAAASVFWLTLSLGSLGLPVVVSWAIVADKGRQYAGSFSGWMNLCGNLGGVVSPILCGFLADVAGWQVALLFNVIPIALAILCWFFIKPGKALGDADEGTVPSGASVA